MQDQLKNNDASHLPLCDMFVVFLALMILIFILPGWLLNGSCVYSEIVILLVPVQLAAIVGFLLVLRCGTLDLSVWAVMGLGGLVGASMLNSGYSITLSFLCALGTGTLAGGLNGLLSSVLPVRKRYSGMIVTAVVGIAIILVTGAIFPEKIIRVENGTFDPFAQMINNVVYGGSDENLELAPLYIGKMMLSFLSWASVLIFLMVYELVPFFARTSDRGGHFAALVVSGFMASMSGFCWLIESSFTPVPTRLVDGLFIPAVVVLAGGWLMRGQGRTLLAGMYLPGAAILVAIWEMAVWPLDVMGYSVSLLVLILMVLGAQASFLKMVRNPRRTIALVSPCVLFVLGLLIMVSTGIGDWPLPVEMMYFGCFLGLVATIIMVSHSIAGRKAAGRLQDRDMEEDTGQVAGNP